MKDSKTSVSIKFSSRNVIRNFGGGDHAYLGPWNSANLGGSRRILATILNSVRARAGAGAVPLYVTETLRHAPNFPAAAAGRRSR